MIDSMGASITCRIINPDNPHASPIEQWALILLQGILGDLDSPMSERVNEPPAQHQALLQALQRECVNATLDCVPGRMKR
jgi:hypothetical protein